VNNLLAGTNGLGDLGKFKIRFKKPKAKHKAARAMPVRTPFILPPARKLHIPGLRSRPHPMVQPRAATGLTAVNISQRVRNAVEQQGYPNWILSTTMEDGKWVFTVNPSVVSNASEALQRIQVAGKMNPRELALVAVRIGGRAIAPQSKFQQTMQSRNFFDPFGLQGLDQGDCPKSAGIGTAMLGGVAGAYFADLRAGRKMNALTLMIGAGVGAAAHMVVTVLSEK